MRPPTSARKNAVGRRSVRRVDLDLADVVEQRVEARAAEHADLRLVRQRSSSILAVCRRSVPAVGGTDHRRPTTSPPWTADPATELAARRLAAAASPSSTPTSGALATDDPEAAWERWRTTREALYREHAAVAGPARGAGGVPGDATGRTTRPLRFEVQRSTPAPPPALGGLGALAGLALALPNSGADSLSFRRIGRVTVPFPAGDAAIWRCSGWRATPAACSSPFRDATNGTETYGAGRYLLDAAKSADLGGDPARRHAGPRLQLRLPAVVRVRSEVGLPARAAREPARPADPGRRTSRVTADDTPGPPRRPVAARPATVADTDAIGALHVRAWDAAYRGLLPDSLLDAMDARVQAAAWTRVLRPESRTRLLVADRDGMVVGFAAYGPNREPDLDPKVGELYAIYVDPPAWGTGAGHALMDAVVAGFPAAGWSSGSLRVLTANTRARAFYERHGWVFERATEPYEADGEHVPEVRYRRPG